MFSFEELEAKIEQLVANVEQSAANHHILVGTKLAYQNILAEAKKAAQNMETVASTVETVVDAVQPVVN